MGIQINGQTDIISATDGNLTISGADLPTVTNLNATGIVTATSFSGPLTGNVTGNLTGTASTATAAATAYGLSGSPTLSGITSVSTTNLTVNGNAYPTAGPLSNRNIVINGAMQVAQRGTVVNAGNEYAGPDRMRFSKNDGAFTISQSTDVPSGQGFGNSWKCDVTSVAGTAGSYYVILEHRIEGRNLQMLKKGTASAENFTVQFWIKTSKTGTYIVEMRDTDNNRSISQSYTVSAADTWEKKILTFDGDTSGVLDNDNGSSLTILLWIYAGSTFTSGTLQTSWGAETDANKAVGQVNAADNTANNIYITGLQLEVGSVATPFEHRSYGQELALCQRYLPAINGSDGNGYLDVGYIQASNQMNTIYRFSVPTRTKPTGMTVSTPGNCAMTTQSAGGTWSSVLFNNSTITSAQFTVTMTTSSWASQINYMAFWSVNSGLILFTGCEL